jgi:long-chain fatty acid transport protein
MDRGDVSVFEAFFFLGVVRFSLLTATSSIFRTTKSPIAEQPRRVCCMRFGIPNESCLREASKMKPQFFKARLGLFTAVLALFLALVPAAQATNGYFTHGYGTIAKALAGAGVAMTQDTLAAGTNPASLAFLGKRYDIGVSVFSPTRSYTIEGNPSGFPGTFGLAPGKVESESDTFFIPQFGANWQLNESNYLGVVVYGHGGMNTDYPTDTFWASSPTGVNLEQLFVGVPWSYKYSEKHAFSIMPIFVYQTFEAQGVGSFAPFSSAPTKLSDNGASTSTGYGAKIGYMGQWWEKFSFGASYQTEMKMGEFDDYAGLFAEQGAFNVPSTWTAGFAIKPTQNWAVMMDLQKMYYSDIKSINNPLLPNLMTARLGDEGGAGFGWRDMDVVKIGLQYDTLDRWVWRAGVSIGSQPIPASEVMFNILAPGVMEEHMAFGFTRKIGETMGLDFALMYAPEVEVSGPNPLEFPGAQQITLAMDQLEISLNYSWGIK